MDNLYIYFTWYYAALAITLIYCTIVLIRHYCMFFVPLYKRPYPKPDKDTPESTKSVRGLSVVLSGEKQHDKLKVNLPFWLNQTHPLFEIVVVYDDSEENLHTLLTSLKHDYPKLVTVHVDHNLNFFDEKKFSLSIGVKSAKYDYVVLSTADCRPDSEQCLSYMEAAIDDNTAVVAGYCTYPSDRSSAMGRFFCNEITVQHLGFITKGMPYVASHQMLLYCKNTFLENQGYIPFYSLDNGNYDILCNYFSQAKDIKVQTAPQIKLRSGTRLAFSNWITKERQNYTSLSFKNNKAIREWTHYKIVLVLFYLTILAYVLISCFSFSSALEWSLSLWPFVFASMLLMKIISQSFILYRVNRHLGEKNLWWRASWFEVLYILLMPVIFIGRKKTRHRL